MKADILIIPGDGVGKEVTPWGKKALEKIAEIYKHTFSFGHALMGHAAIVETGDALPEETLTKARKSNAILFGAIGHPKYDSDPSKYKVRPEQGLLKIRKELNLFANIRPIIIFDSLIDASPLKKEIVKNTDIMIYRELTGDVYFGEKQESPDGQTASDLMIYNKNEIERIAHLAFKQALLRKKHVCSVDKANVLKSSQLWRRTVIEIAEQYPDVTCEHMFVDNAAMQLIKRPSAFDIVLTSNLFGDILSDEASQITGSLGMLASASSGGGIGFYEPIHGSAHDISGKNIANPIASILSAALMFEIEFGLIDESKTIIHAIEAVLSQGYRTADLSMNGDKDCILGTEEMGQKIIDQIK